MTADAYGMRCDSCKKPQSALFVCSCQMLVCEKCRQARHEAHYRAWREAD